MWAPGGSKRKVSEVRREEEMGAGACTGQVSTVETRAATVPECFAPTASFRIPFPGCRRQAGLQRFPRVDKRYCEGRWNTGMLLNRAKLQFEESVLIAKGRWTEGKGGSGERERSGDEAEAGECREGG